MGALQVDDLILASSKGRNVGDPSPGKLFELPGLELMVSSNISMPTAVCTNYIRNINALKAQSDHFKLPRKRISHPECKTVMSDLEFNNTCGLS